MFDSITLIWSDVTAQFFDPRKRLFIGYLISACCIGVIWLCLARRQSIGEAVRSVFDRDVWFSRSSRYDLICFLINRLLFSWLRPVLVTQLVIATMIFELLHYQTFITVGLWDNAGYWVAAVSFTIFFFIFDDFSRFAVHYALHRIPALWAFHKFHHSAETLTPLTVTRTHPVEGLIFTTRSAVVQGVTIAGFVFLFGNQVDLLTIFGVNVFVVVFHGLGSNLRHSHVAIRYPQVVERVLMSPAQHQLHHSEAVQHYDRNFGVALSVWDWMFGSFHHSVAEPLTFGIGRETTSFTRSIWSMYWLPVRSLLARVTRLGVRLTGRTRLPSPSSAKRRIDHGLS